MTGHSEAYERFMASTPMTYERWHDGEPYDLGALGELDERERDEIQAWLIRHEDRDWRDLEALVALGTPVALAAVRGSLVDGPLELSLSAARALPQDPAVEPLREAAIVAGLERATMVDGLNKALDLAVEHPTPAVVDALFRAALRDDREAAVHAAARLAFLHGHAKEPFDWARRAFYLRFGVEDAAERRRAFLELCAECDVDPARYL